MRPVCDGMHFSVIAGESLPELYTPAVEVIFCHFYELVFVPGARLGFCTRHRTV